MEIPFNTDSLAKQVSVKSAVNPSLWACAVISLPMLILGATVEGGKSIVFIVIGIVPIATFVGSYVYFLLKAPEYLRSEDYQIKAESLKLLGDKDGLLQAKAEDVVSVVTNPQLSESSVDQSIVEITKGN